jgi:hypothetical protein
MLLLIVCPALYQNPLKQLSPWGKIHCHTCSKFFFFFLIVFGGTEVPIIFNFPLPPLRGQPTVKSHPRWQPISGLAVHCRLGRLLDSNPGLQFYNLVSLPMSHHCSQQPPLLPTATTAPNCMLKVAPVSTKYLSLVNSSVRKIKPGFAGKCIAVAVACVGKAAEPKGVRLRISFPTKNRAKCTC